jgi:hypothetical protein
MERREGEAARRGRGHSRGKISDAQGEEALDSGIELNNTGAAEMRIGGDAQ